METWSEGPECGELPADVGGDHDQQEPDPQQQPASVGGDERVEERVYDERRPDDQQATDTANQARDESGELDRRGVPDSGEGSLGGLGDALRPVAASGPSK